MRNNHLAWLRDQLGGQFLAGVVIYTGENVVQLEDRLVAALICILWT